MVGDTVIMRTTILGILAQMPGMNREQAHQLLDPGDKQNVPKAVRLLQELNEPGKLPKTVHPGELKQRHALAFFAKFLSLFLLPFIKVDMSLSEQVRSLVTYAHVAVALYRKHGTDCLTGPLYTDSLCIVKDVVRAVARLQLIDPRLALYLIHIGTDRLEAVFSDVRTQDHSRNFDSLQLCHKLATGSLVVATLERHPDLDRGSRRLNLLDAKGIDHVNVDSWIGNPTVGDCELFVEWGPARDNANNLLEYGLGPTARVDFVTLFSKPGHDMLRPNGQYVGFKYHPSDARSEEEEDGTAASSVVPPTVAPDDAIQAPALEGLDTSDSHQLQQSQAPAQTAGQRPMLVTREQIPLDDDSEALDDELLGVEADDFFPDTVTDGPSYK